MTAGREGGRDGAQTRQGVVGAGNARQAVQFEGTQINYFPGIPEAAPLPSLEPPWGLVRSRRILARDEIIEEISVGATAAGPENNDEEPGVGPSLVLCGVGGVGKTTVALGVCRRARARRRVWWVSAIDKASFESGMRAVGYAAGARPEDFAQSNAADTVWTALYAHEEPWLLVIDDANDVSVLGGPRAIADERGWLRRPPLHGSVLVVSRDGTRSTWRWLTVRKLRPLASHDGARLLLELAPQSGTKSAAAALSTRLGGLPQLLELAGSTLAENSRVPDAWVEAGMLRRFSDYTDAMVSHDAGARPAKNLETLFERVWEISFDQIDSIGLAHARPVLLLLCCFEDGPIPHERVLHPADLAQGLIPGITANSLLAAIEGLNALGLLTIVLPAKGDAADGPEPGPDPMISIPDVLLAAARAHPDLKGSAGHRYKRMAMKSLLNGLGRHVTRHDASELTAGPGTRVWPGPLLRQRSTDASQSSEQHILTALERMLERQLGTYSEELTIDIEIAADAGDRVIERRSTTPGDGFVCRSVEPITPDGRRQVWDLTLESPEPATFRQVELYALLGTIGRLRIIVFLPAGDGPVDWVMRYQARGLWDDLRRAGEDYLYYDMRGPRGGPRSPVTRFEVRFQFPVGDRGSVTETRHSGTPTSADPSGDNLLVWRTAEAMRGRYRWNLSMNAPMRSAPPDG